WPQTVILSVLAKDLAMRSKARCFASTLSMTTVAVPTVYDLPGFLGTPFRTRPQPHGTQPPPNGTERD
ncbi:MAG: hypothetical protein ABSH20_25080, partial [Tepidisphaeraceae bacterium]